MRTIRIVSTTHNNVPFSFNSDFTTFGELRDFLYLNYAINTKDMAVRVKETRNHLELASALLPQTDCTLYITVKKTSGACETVEELRTKINKLLDKFEKHYTNNDSLLKEDYKDYLAELEEEGL